MLRNLLDEIIRRRLWPIPAVALLVLVMAPLLFLKGSPEGSPAIDNVVPAAAEAKLPDRAARLLATSDGATVKGRATGAASDPFSPPAAVRAAAAAAASGGGGAATPPATGATTGNGAASNAAPAQPAPVVVQNGDGRTPRPSGSSPGRSPGSTPARTSPVPEIAVDIRYGAVQNSKVRRAIPRMQPFYIHGKLVAVFVKYSPSRKKATFAVAPGVLVTGPVKCRQQDGVCRYVDIPAGSHVRLTTLSSTRNIVSRRLDVVRTKRSSSSSTRATAASTASERACLLRKLQAQKAGDAPLERDACEK
ncbi:MAG: hypothetical protein Q8O56_04890 [Solirubrobacteraceae bacterium]|nr:hypothetical protein [Solirubrobacteraceae bacterium]